MYLWHLLAYQIWAFQSIEVFDNFWTLCARASSVSVPAYAVCSIPTNKLQRAQDRRPSARPCTWWGSATSRLLPREIWGPLISSGPSSTSHVFRHDFQLDYRVAEKKTSKACRATNLGPQQSLSKLHLSLDLRGAKLWPRHGVWSLLSGALQLLRC